VSALEPPAIAERMRVLGGTWPEPIVLDSVDSTNTVLAGLPGDSDGLCVVADEQTAGRGRLDRAWVSNAGAGLWMSVRVLLTGVPAERWPLLPMVAALSARDALEAACGVHAGIKWPNDLLVSGRKIAGLLAEVSGSVAIVGIGINVEWSKDTLPFPEATSVHIEGGNADRAELLARLLVTLEQSLHGWRAGDASVIDRFRESCVTLGRDVTVRLPDGSTLAGMATAIDDRGQLVVSRGSSSVSISAGDVIHATIASWDTRPSSSPPVK